MSSDQAYDLLTGSIPPHLMIEDDYDTRVAAMDLVAELGCLPLAITQAAANMRAQQMAIHAYAKMYRSRQARLSLLQTPVARWSGSNGVQSILTTWEMSFEDIRQQNVRAADCLSYMAFFDCRSIPKSAVKLLPGLYGSDDIQYHGILAPLLLHSLVEETYTSQEDSHFEMHPVIHERISQRLSAEDFLHYSAPVVELLGRLFSCGHGLRETIGWGLAHKLLPHATHCLDVTSYIATKLAGTATLMQANFLGMGEQDALTT
ncbi:hypothetical protein LTR78_010320 [Recurvomyces mirabilis]|uniref:Uncharacterized protein n=2 Tax=Recurvomyces mirabilis TaxID=574656 RepID=A0AAE0WI99_9PEZI|nr:hypothetical protein LTR78_010320 [Recurvomyces mirabilis]